MRAVAERLDRGPPTPAQRDRATTGIDRLPLAVFEAGLRRAVGRVEPRTPGMSLFGLHRRLRGALIGQLAAFEMTSSLPNRAYGNGLRRLGGTPDATRFYDEHVIADAVHEQIAAHDLCGSFAAAEPEAAADVLFGARCAMLVDARRAEELLARFRSRPV